MLQRRFDKLFLVFFLTIFFTFFYFRPLNSSWYRIITADALGYYAYLPAKFIYNDKDLGFKWFNDVYNKYYSYNSFAVPDENFMAPFKEKRINKYYPGLSFLWLPFFVPVHLTCKVFHLNANGFSMPYQLAIGFATLIYVCLGLFYLRKLLLKLFRNEFLAFFLPIAVYYGTNLFSFTIYVGTFSHAYSFTFITMAFYFAYCFFNERENKLRNFLWFGLCFLIVIFIRPFNILFLLGIPFLIEKFSLKELSIKPFDFTKKNVLVLVLIVSLTVYQFGLLFNQTHSLFPNTYSNERFYFNRPNHLFDVLFSYYAGWFVYVPLAFIAMFSIFFIKKNVKILFLFLLLAVVIFLYSNWWYYTILTRTIVDFTAVIAILLAILFVGFLDTPKLFKTAIVIVFLSVSYFQLKAYQLRNNILDNNYTYSEYFWRNFFTIRPICIFPVHPETIINQKLHFEGFEENTSLFVIKEEKHSGNFSYKLCGQNHFSPEYNTKLPEFYKDSGIRKVKISFWLFMTEEIGEIQLLCKIYSGKDKVVQEFPFYINKDRCQKDKWNYLEYGFDVAKEATPGDSLKVFFWNEKGYNKAYLDDIKTEIFLTNESMEMIP